MAVARYEGGRERRVTVNTPLRCVVSGRLRTIGAAIMRGLTECNGVAWVFSF